MKRKGNINVITDNDVIVTGASNAGNNLDVVVEKMSEDILDLKSQLKWTHKYGAVGSGSGGGGGSLKWNLTATLDGQPISSGNIISLSNGASTYSLRIAVSGGSSEYNVTYNYNNNPLVVTLSSNNNWKTEIPIKLSANGNITIEVTDNIQIKNVYASYIVVPFTFGDLQLVNENLDKYLSNDIYIDRASENGLYIKCDYDIVVNAECTYTWTFIDEEPISGTIENKNGYLLYQIPEKYLDDEYANSYNVKLSIRISPENQEARIINKTITFNLIPSTIYLKLLPQVGLIYDSEIESEDIYKYSINREIAFSCRIYQGVNQSRECSVVYWKDGDTESALTHRSREGETFTLKVSYDTPGWHSVTFRYSMGSFSGEVTKYLYCQKVSSDYNWFKPSVVPSLQYFYKGYETTKTLEINEPITTSNIQVYRSNVNNIIYHFGTKPDNIGNILINIGIQYSEINNTSDPICIIRSNEYVSTNEFITVYQNKIVFSGVFGGQEQKCNFFLHKEENYSAGDLDNYHLITIAISPVYEDLIQQQIYYEYEIYLDGVLEGALNIWPTAVKILGLVEFCPGNYSINHFSVDYFYNGGSVSSVHDSDINYYYYSYLIKSRNDLDVVSAEDTNVLNFLYDSSTNKVNYYMDHDLVHVENTLYDNIARNIEIPTLVARVSKIQETIQNQPSIYDWINRNYTQDSTDELAKAKIILNELRWGKNKTETSAINVPDGFSNYHFYLKLQGSSTMNNKSKNFTLGLETSDEGDQTILLFSPNYQRDDYSSFLHETQFTLKADVVDSAHTNNVAIGRFVNENNKFDYYIGQNASSDILKHVRQCLDGFPILMYLEVVDGSNVDTYYLGVYSFNLGRESYFNLGYCDLSQLNPDYIDNATNTSFSFTTVGYGDQKGLKPLDGFAAAEVQDNSKYWDFSQFDNTILFQQNNERANFMFGDIVAADNSEATTSIKNFVESVSLGGGYLFSEMGKTFEAVNNVENPEDMSVLYHKPNVVPDYKIQYQRNGGMYYQKIETLSPATYNDLFNCIGGIADDTLIKGKLNYNSLAYYYTTCMAFGLVDSVQKNLNIKTWDNSEYGLFFYDMDTCLGRDNDGNPTSYFCFSDYWKSDIKEYDSEGNLIDRTLPEDVNKVAETIVNNGVTVYRDYFPLSSDITGYDIPSSYLFAIAKYTKALSAYDSNPNFLSPQTIYGKWRTVNGPLETAKKFIDKYYGSNLAGVPDCMLNLNYRNKYLYYRESDENRIGFSNVSKYLFGRGVEVTTEWLKGRLHILDAYFNMENEDIIIYSGNTTYMEPKRITVGLENNQDVVILKDIFQAANEPWRRDTSVLEFVVKAPAYTPLIIQGSTFFSQYLLEKDNFPYTIRTSFNGKQTSVFGGSQLWTDLNSINSFVSSSSSDNGNPLYINNKYLEYLNGTDGVYTGGFNFVLPAVKEIVLNSPGYIGALSIDNSFYNLSYIDISKSSIVLTVDESRVTTIDARDINSSSLTLVNCNNLQSVLLNGASINSCDIRPAWTKDINLSENKIKSLSVAGKMENDSYGTLEISNNSTIENINFSEFNTVNISDCASLKTVVHSDDPPVLTSLTITNCTELTSLTVLVDKLTTLNLSGCTSLTRLILKGSDFTKLRKLNLYQTKVEYIEYDDDTDTSCLDLSRFTNLATSSSTNTAYVRLGSNPAVRVIKLKNVSSSPVYLSYNLQGCTNLERIYGNIRINVSACFKNLRKFSIHGPDLQNVIWHGESVLDGTRVRYPKDITSDYFSDDPNATNITFYTSTCTESFSTTNCTIFDYYYILSNLGNGKNLGSLFSYPQNTAYGRFNIENDNNPDIRLFENCSAVTSLSFCFGYSAGSNHIYLQSPTISENTVVTDDGLFSALINCTNINGIFYSYSYVCDRYLFRRKNGNYKITSYTYFTPNHVLNNPPENYSWSTIVSTYTNYKENTGNLEGFFTNLPSIATITGFFNGVGYIDYSKIFIIPETVTTLKGAFVSTRAYCDNFILENYFSNPSTIQYLLNSFRMTGSITEDYYVNMELNNNTFSKFINILQIGYSTSAPFDVPDYTGSCFAGFSKKISADGFPFNIFANNTKATKLIAIFANATSSVNYSNLKLPNDLFRNNTKLTDITGMFYNMNVNYQLSDDESINFKNCENIQILDYAFAESATNSKLPSLSGNIPYKFFWHGEQNVSKTYYGTNEREPIYENEEIVGYEYINPQPYTVYTKNVNTTISSMRYCFQHSNLSAYVNTDIDSYIEPNPSYAPYTYYSESINGTFKTNNNIDNREYTFIWAFDGSNLPSNFTSITKNNYELLDRTISSELADIDSDCTYETVTYPTGGGIGNPIVSSNYIAPPDLLRYCTIKCDIRGLFAYSGVQGWDYSSNNSGGYNQYGYGLTGRICPYMLKPVYETENLANLFRCCKKLSYYRYNVENRGDAYLIPEDFFTYAKKVVNLTSMFEDTLQPQLSNLSTIFKPLTGTLTITRLFYASYWDGNKYPGIYTQLSNAFNTHSIANMEKAFCITTVASNEPTNRIRDQFVKFSNMFNTRYKKTTYSTNLAYSDVFRGYRKIGDGENERFGIKTLVDNNITNNYTL